MIREFLEIGAQLMNISCIPIANRFFYAATLPLRAVVLYDAFYMLSKTCSLYTRGGSAILLLFPLLELYTNTHTYTHSVILTRETRTKSYIGYIIHKRMTITRAGDNDACVRIYINVCLAFLYTH